jgi:dTDP-4-amino-4,6-dideoxy-D-galactose acyltransferase
MAGVLDVSRLGPPGFGARTGWTPRAWDSAFFGVSIAQITANRSTPEDLARAVRDAQDASIDCLYFLADAEDPESARAAEANGFSLVDIRLTLECSVGAAGHTAPPHEGDASIRTARLDDLPALMALARESHRNTRFYQDTRFDSARSDELYAVWIERSISGEWAEVVWVVDVDAAPRGYLTVSGGTDAATIGLVAVDPAYRGRGYGDRLLHAAVRWASDRGLPRVSVVTQGRSPAAVRFYQRAGFTISLAQFWYHRWTDDSQRASTGRCTYDRGQK